MTVAIGDLPAILPTYPSWVRTVMFSSALVWIVVYLVLLFKAPPPPPKLLTFDSLGQVMLANDNESLVFDIVVTNNTGEAVSITKADLVYFKDEIKTDGLQSLQKVSATYEIAKDEKGLVSTTGDGITKRVDTEIITPFAGQPQSKVSIELSQIIKDGEGDRFLISLKDRKIVDVKNNKLQVTLTYGEDKIISKEANLSL